LKNFEDRALFVSGGWPSSHSIVYIASLPQELIAAWLARKLPTTVNANIGEII